MADEINNGLSPEVELELDGIDVNPTLDVNVDGLDVNPTLEMELQVEMGSRSSERNAEAWAVGERGGVPVSSTDQTYHNNSKYYAEQAGNKADKVSGATSGNLAGLDSNGNLTDSGKKAADFVNVSDFYATEMPVSSSDSTKVSAALASQKADIEELESSKADAIEVTDSTPASVMTFSDGADGMPVKSLVVGIEPVQTGSGDPAPDNVRPISGWTGMNVTRAGKNLFDKTKITEDVYINSAGEIISSASFSISDYIPVVAGTQFSYKGLTKVGTNPRAAYYNAQKQWVSALGIGTQSYTKTVPDGVSYIRFSICKESGHNDKETLLVVYGSEIGEYEAYNGDAITITFPETPGTVYGGTLEVYGDGTGKLTVDRAGFTLDEITEFYGTTSQGSYKYTRPVIDSSLLKESNSITTQAEALKSVKQSATKSAYSCYVDKPSNGTESIYVICDTDTTVEYYNANIAGSKIIAKLKTPVEYTLTSAQVGQITTLLGTNNIWSDTGDIVSIEYPADTKLYVDRKAAETRKLIEIIITANREDAMEATKAYSSGDLLIVNGTLYKATASIANGATITVGTNVTATTVASEIAALA